MRILPLGLVLALLACKTVRQPEGAPFSDDFEGQSLKPAWHSTGVPYRVQAGELVIDHAYNHPLWLSSPIPKDAVIELDAWSNNDAGDIKLEAWGDGKSAATQASYTATSYVFIFGGWNNQVSAICRLDEHGRDRKTRSDVRVQKGRRYHFRIVRKGGHIDWQVDGQPFLTFDDPAPLAGPDHAYLGINDWEVELHFDNLRVQPL
jgi:hypothetical protein